MIKKIISPSVIISTTVTATFCIIFFNRIEILALLDRQNSSSWAGAIATAAAAFIALWFGVGQNLSARRNEMRQGRVLHAAISPECTLLLQRLLTTEDSLAQLKIIEIGSPFEKHYLNWSSLIVNKPALEITKQLFNELHRLPGKKGELVARIYANLMLLRGEMSALVAYDLHVPMHQTTKKSSENALTRMKMMISDLMEVVEISESEVPALVTSLVETVEVDGKPMIYQGTSTE